MNDKSQLTSEIIKILRQLDSCHTRTIKADSHLLAELDLDSLELLEFTELINARFGLQLLEPPHTMRHLTTPEMIASVIEASAHSHPSS